MQFNKHDLGHRAGGEIVEVILKGNAANVRLMDSSNVQSYRSGRRFDFTGGHYKSSLVRLEIPNPEHWFAAVDLAGYAGKVGSSARVLSGDMQPLREVL